MADLQQEHGGHLSVVFRFYLTSSLLPDIIRIDFVYYAGYYPALYCPSSISPASHAGFLCLLLRGIARSRFLRITPIDNRHSNDYFLLFLPIFA
ncbi:MAG: hypothetical protein II644_01850 [Paludibacteraceae bacterium]|nr:hypothetical protein [Paludibacteraceae bacterium]